jgi:hypothetical protein
MRILGILGLGICVSCTLVVLATIIYSGFYGWQVTIKINDFHEAIPEIILLAVAIGLGITALVKIIKSAGR